MKIALISTPFFKLPPMRYGGLELIVWNLWCGLIERGHKVVAFAPDESSTPKGGYLYKVGKGINTLGVNWLEAERERWMKYDKCLDNFDIVHSHDWFSFCYASKTRNPSILCTHTHHGHINYWLDRERKNPWWARPSPFKLNLIAISEHMKRLYDTGYNGNAPPISSECCHNGIELGDYPFMKEKSERLLFLGRIDPIKGPHTAIQVAEKSKTPIDIVGATSFVTNTHTLKK